MIMSFFSYEFVVITLLALAVLLTLPAGVVSFFIGRRRGLRSSANRVKELQEQVGLYREIAESHEVKWTGWPEDGSEAWTQTAPFRSRTYDGTMQDNLDALERDLQGFEPGAYLRITPEWYFLGAWSNHLELYWNGFHNPTVMDSFGRLSRQFTGSAEEVMRELKTHLQEPVWHLRSGGNWAAPYGTCRMEVKAEVWKKVDAPLRPQVVEVKIAVPVEVQPKVEPSDDLDLRIQTAVEVALAEDRLRKALHVESSSHRTVVPTGETP
jgi:hypothetical protein